MQNITEFLKQDSQAPALEIVGSRMGLWNGSDLKFWVVWGWDKPAIYHILGGMGWRALLLHSGDGISSHAGQHRFSTQISFIILVEGDMGIISHLRFLKLFCWPSWKKECFLRGSFTMRTFCPPGPPCKTSYIPEVYTHPRCRRLGCRANHLLFWGSV